MTSDKFRRYYRKQITEMRPYEEGESVEDIFISEIDRDNGSPRYGDMIARGPKNHEDQWLIPAAYFVENFEPVE